MHREGNFRNAFLSYIISADMTSFLGSGGSIGDCMKKDQLMHEKLQKLRYYLCVQLLKCSLPISARMLL